MLRHRRELGRTVRAGLRGVGLALALTAAPGAVLPVAPDRSAPAASPSGASSTTPAAERSFAASTAASPGRIDVEVRGGDPGARKIASRAARDWSRLPGAVGSMDGLLGSIGAALAKHGWGRGEIEASIDSLEGGSRRCRITLRDLAPARLAEWVWDPPEGAPPLEPGRWSPEEAEADIWDLVGQRQETGHPFASIQILEAASGDGGMVVRARLREGPAFRLRSVVFEGRGATRQRFLERLSGLRMGEMIRPSRAGTARDRLERSGLFSRAQGPWLRSPESGEASLVYRLVALPQNQAEGAIGYDGTQRLLSGYVRVAIGNLFGTGRRMNAAWERYARDRSRLNLAYREPYLLGLPLAAEGVLAQEIEDSTWTVDDMRLLLDGDLGGGLTARLGMGAHRTVQSGPASGRTRSLLTLAGLTYDTRTEAGTRGGRSSIEIQRGELSRSPKTAGGDGTLLRVLALTDRSQPIGRQGLLRAEISAGWVQGPDSLPRPEAAAMGGGSSLRGYPEQMFRVVRYGLARIEPGLRVMPEGNRAYFFFDGAIYRPWPRGKTKRASAYGVGFRIRGAGGWVRLDYGIPSGEPPLSGRIHFGLETKF